MMRTFDGKAKTRKKCYYNPLLVKKTGLTRRTLFPIVHNALCTIRKPERIEKESEKKTMENILILLQEYKLNKNDIKEKERKLDELREKIVAYMDNSPKTVIDKNGKRTFNCGQYKATISEKSRTSIDKALLESLYPEIAKECEKVTTYDEFRVS
jgi:hypothetical protein